MKYGFLGILFLLPLISFAQTTGSLQGLIEGTLGLINDVLIPFVLGIAFLIFVINAIRFFVVGGSTDEGKENAKSLALYSIGAFVLILSFWGLINIITRGIGLADDPCIPGSDYITDRYGVRSSTSCPPPAGDVIIPPNQPVMPISPPDPSIILPGTDTPPTTGTPPTQFTPDGDPINPALADYTPIRSFADTVRTQANSYLNSELPIYLGGNADAVTSALFADLSGAHQNSMTDYNRTVAMIRLENAGVLAPNTAFLYAALLTNYYDEAYDQPPLDIMQAVIDSTKAVPIPSSIIINMDKTRNAVITALNNWDSRNTPELLDAELFDKTKSIAVRLLNFKQYYSPEFELYTPFLQDLNTENLFLGNTNVIK